MLTVVYSVGVLGVALHFTVLDGIKEKERKRVTSYRKCIVYVLPPSGVLPT